MKAEWLRFGFNFLNWCFIHLVEYTGHTRPINKGFYVDYRVPLLNCSFPIYLIPDCSLTSYSLLFLPSFKRAV